MGSQQCCQSQISIITNQSIQLSKESDFTNDIDVLRKAIIQPIKPQPLNKLQNLEEAKDEDLDMILNHFYELEKKKK